MTPVPPVVRRRGRLSWPAVGLLVYGLCLATFAVFEVTLRLLDRDQVSQSFGPIFMSDPIVGYRPRPGARLQVRTSEYETTVRINQAGVRADHEFVPKAVGERRVMVLGDSQVMAVQVPLRETFTAQVEARLAGGAPHRVVQVINAGVQGYGPVEQYLFLANYLLDFDPDLVLVTVYAGNDATDAADAEHRLVEATGSRGSRTGPAPVPSRGSLGAPLWLRRLGRRSAAMQFARRRLHALLGPSLQVPIRDRPLDSYLETPPPDVMRGFTVARDALRRSADVASDHGARTAIILLPVAFETVATFFVDLQREHASRDGILTRHGSTDRFAAIIASLDVPFFDAREAFDSMPDPKRLFFASNSHLTSEGHSVLADAITAFIRREALLDSSGQ